MKRALLVTDIQNDFLPGGALAVPDGDAIIPYVTRLMRHHERYELVVVIQDWHPPEHGSFAANHPGAQPFEMGELGGLPQVLWPNHCVQGSHGAQLHSNISSCFAEIARAGMPTLVIQKGQDPAIDSYSAFFDNARRRDTGLDKALKSYGVEAIDIVGLAFDYCVRATALDARTLGYDTRVMMSGTRAIDEPTVAAIIDELERAGVACEVEH